MRANIYGFATLLAISSLVACKDKGGDKDRITGTPPGQQTTEKTEAQKEKERLEAEERRKQQEAEARAAAQNNCGESLDECPKVGYKAQLTKGATEAAPDELFAQIDSSTRWEISLIPNAAVDQRDIKIQVVGQPGGSTYVDIDDDTVQLIVNSDEEEVRFLKVIVRAMDRCKLLASEDSSIDCQNFEREIRTADNKFNIFYRIAKDREAAAAEAKADAEERRRKAAAAGCIGEKVGDTVKDGVGDLVKTGLEYIISPGDVGACDEAKGG